MNKAIKILHLTDLHLFGNPNTRMVGVNPLEALQKVVTKILTESQQNYPDLTILTGDISQDYSLESYQMAMKILQQIPGQLVATMGNHDHKSSFTKIFGSPSQMVTKIANLTKWKIIVLDSHWTEHVEGVLTTEQIDFLQEKLSEDTLQPTIIFLHHHVLPVASAWLDQINIKDSAQFLEVVSKYKNIKAVVCGHVHQDTTVTHQGVTYLSTPATSWQFAIKSPRFKVDSLMPGYRWLELYEDETIQTTVVRIDHDNALVPDVNSKGY